MRDYSTIYDVLARLIYHYQQAHNGRRPKFIRVSPEELRRLKEICFWENPDLNNDKTFMGVPLEISGWQEPRIDD